MVVVIDTSSPCSALALVGSEGRIREDLARAGREDDLPARARALVGPAGFSGLAGVAVGLGPGSFTGLRVGVSFGVGLAMGLGVPLLGLDSLDLQRARTDGPVTALIEAGRGRLYWQGPQGEPHLGDPEDLPREFPAVGWLRPATVEAVNSRGIRLLPEADLQPFGRAAASLLGTAVRLGYDTVRLKYMQSFRTRLE